jgi:hypothetical protein
MSKRTAALIAALALTGCADRRPTDRIVTCYEGERVVLGPTEANGYQRYVSQDSVVRWYVTGESYRYDFTVLADRCEEAPLAKEPR